MALRVAEQWKQFFTAAGIPSAESKTYAATFATNRINKTTLPVLLKDYLSWCYRYWRHFSYHPTCRKSLSTIL